MKNIPLVGGVRVKLPHTCTDCGVPLLSDGSNFPKLKTRKTVYYDSRCRDCKNKSRVNWKPKEIVIPESKLCPRCDAVKLANDFPRTKTNSSGLLGYCKDCYREVQRAYIKEHPRDREKEKQRLWVLRLKKDYGLTLEQFEKLLKEQDYLDPISGEVLTRENRRVDHDHATGKVRGVLTDPTNWLLGHAKDNPRTLMKAIVYLSEGYVD